MTTGLKIKEVAERSGFTANTLRYYEQIGLLPETERTPAGYRLYDQRTLDRLAFIARAKQLGCSLDEITGLTTAWDGGRCGPIQDQLRALVTHKVQAAQVHIAELMTFTSELQRAADALERHRPEGACDDQCGCVADNASGASAIQAVSLSAKPTRVGQAEIACTLDAGSMTTRMHDWQSLLSHGQHRQRIDGGIRTVFSASVPLDALIGLAAAEQNCCRFFQFTIMIDDRGVALEVRAPADALPIIESMFGAPA